ncbi:ABC transporter ATP-binding protein [Microbacterium marinilacus]|uniref:ABC transporter ATP-binding protein n=1 Tax=Microbacterium marinilacus TaxID=415209 RepID=A0ABP7BC75_9MICO|nr:ABC transporter ATP-binding protein [Microbacterium marinilacus]MBY0687149.1 ABC transporter ATP-binding protein/permease [Microbacterium marinilacus]
MSRATRRGGTGRSLRTTFSIARPHLRGHGLLIAGGMATLLVEVVLRVLEPWPIKVVVDAVSVSLGADSGATAGLPAATVPLLLACGVLLLGLVGLRAIAQYCSTIAFALVGSRVATALRARVFAHLQSLGLGYHSHAKAGDTVQRVIGDIGRLQEVAVTAGLPLVGNIVTLVVLSVVMLVLDPLLAVVVLLAAGAYLLLSRRGAPRITAAARSTRRSEGDLANTAAETLGAIRVVQAYGLEGQRAEAFDRGNARALSQGVKSRRLAAALERSTDVIVGLALAVVLVAGGWRVIDGAMTPGDLVIFTMYLKIALRPLKDLAKYTGRIARATASGERVAELLEERVDIADRPGTPPLGPVSGDIRFDAVTVDDGHGRRLFDELTLDIAAGETVCLLGPSGAGKSTLAGLLTRTSDPFSGAVRIDGVDVRDATVSSVRGSVTVVLQESVLFAASVRDNIRAGRPDASDADVERAARRALAHDFVTALPRGYDTVLGGRGDTLSGGQRQRIAIARALLRDAPIVVLDEATTGLDPAARAAVAASIAELTRGRTTLSVTHDATSVRDADRIVWLEDGRIVEDGTPRSLLADPGSRVAAWFRESLQEAS